MDFESCCEFLSNSVFINMPAVHNSVVKLQNKIGIQKEHEIASLLRAVTCLDLTTLNGDDAFSNVSRLCYKAENPISANVLGKIGFEPSEITCAAVCVYPSKVKDCSKVLNQLCSRIHIASVATGFPSGQYHLKTRLEEIKNCIEDGANEIDIVIDRSLVLSGEWEKLYNEVTQMKKSSEGACLKTIIATGELGSYSNVYKASMICMAAGADFIKTSTGKENVNATLPVGMVMARAIKDYHYLTGKKIGFKPAGGIRTAKDVLLWQALMSTELGPEWLFPELFRIGASSLLGDIEKNIVQYVTKCTGKPTLPFF